MPPRKRKRCSIAQRSSEGDRVQLDDLPQAAAAVIYQCLDARSRTSLASASRWGRDLVLREVRSVELQVHNKAPCKPVTRLLNRICLAAAGRLSVNLEAHGFDINSKSRMLSNLLAPAKQQGGWASVNELALMAFPKGGKPLLKHVSTAFPALQSVKLSLMSVTCADLRSLSACRQLSGLQLHYCELKQTVPISTTSPLSALHSLRQLSVLETDSSIAAGLTQLTGLSLAYLDQEVAESLWHISGLTSLQVLQLDTAGDIAAEQIQCILSSCKQLTSLDLNSAVRQPEFDALLTHAPQLTRLTCRCLYLWEDRSAFPCSWRELVMKHQGFDSETVACLPTGSLTKLAFEDSAVFPAPSPTLKFSIYEMSEPHNLVQIVQRGLMNLTRCPAWQQCGPAVHVRLWGDKEDDMPDLLSLVPSLALLSSKEVKLSIDMCEAAVGASEVQQLGSVLGSSLKQLVLGECEVTDDFWPAVWTHLPGLQQLTIRGSASGAIGTDELASFCSHATRPLQLNLWKYLYNRVGADGKLERQCRVWGVPQVTVAEAIYPDFS